MTSAVASFTNIPSADVKLADYFKRIGFSSEFNPNFETLCDLHQLHTQSIPFENLNPLTGLPVQLDMGSIYEKLVYGGRGGYCFEHNMLFSSVLRSGGFRVQWLAARVMYNVPEGVIPPRGHMLLLINLGGKLFVDDVGFGGLTLPQPLLLEDGKEQKTTYETFRLQRTDEEWTIEALLKDEWRPLYRFNLSEQLLPDYEVVNYYLSTHPRSHFTFTLIAARMENGKRFNLRNLDLSIHERGVSEKSTVQSANELRSLLNDTFLINTTDIDISSIFQRLASRS